MGKVYEVDRVRERIDSIVVDSGSGEKAAQPGYAATLCHPRYKVATMIGCTLSAL